MDVGEQSVKFVENEIENNYKQIMKTHNIKEMYWIDTNIGARCVAHMHDPNNKEENLIVLFPPFVPTE